MIAPVKDAQWGAAPPMLPAGTEIAVLAGNPMRPVPYAIRVKFPAHYSIPAHSHATDENAAVVSSNTLIHGDATAIDADHGGFALTPAGMNHYAFTPEQETTIVLYVQGPVEFKHVDPADNPRNPHGLK